MMAGKKRKSTKTSAADSTATHAVETPAASASGRAVEHATLPAETPDAADAAGEAVAGLLTLTEEKVAGVAEAVRPQIVGWAPADAHRAAGKAARKMVPRTSHAGWVPPHDRPDPVTLLQAQDAARVPELVPIRWGRMSVSPFTFYRGAALAMAADLAATPNSGLAVQACGDAHLMNFGVFASPERTLIFDVNDFDETLPGPWEWDLKRLAASVVVAGRAGGFTREQNREAALGVGRSYREWMGRYAEMGDLDVYYSKVAAQEVLELAMRTRGVRAKKAGQILAKARTRDSLSAFAKLTETVDGVPRIIDTPPLIQHVPMDAEMARIARRALSDYRKTLQEDHRELIDRYQFIDLAMKVVGVGSVGTVALIVLMLGRDDGDPLFLQLKQAGPSVLEAYVSKSRYQNHAHRVVAGQRKMQAASDIFLGWIRGTGAQHLDFYWRQLRDMKGSIETEGARPAGLAMYGGVCAWTLARAHARSGDRIAIAAYLGKTDTFDLALTDFAEAYADQTERDFDVLTKAIKSGKVEVETGV
jgi:uncharacterized protein (DUF2252 family)